MILKKGDSFRLAIQDDKGRDTAEFKLQVIESKGGLSIYASAGHYSDSLHSEFSNSSFLYHAKTKQLKLFPVGISGEDVTELELVVKKKGRKL
jgi:hypothetical protein